MILLVALAAIAEPKAAAFPERTPELIEACLANAVEAREVSVTEDSHKYICTGEPAEQFWAFLVKSKIDSYEQDTASEGHWLSREFPLGACFKRSRMADGTRASTGLSCTIWIPRVSSE
jgi:hypothetical protein